MSVTYFEIVDGKRRRSKPCGTLSISPEEGYRIELSEEATTRDVPAFFVPFVERSERSINDKWARRWIQERICPPGRQNLGEVLNAHGLNEYDELTLLRSSQARSSQDDFIVRELQLGVTNNTASGHDRNRTGLGILIRSRREALGLSQSDLARAAGIDQPSLSRIEAGKANVTFDLLTDILRELNTEIPFFALGEHECLWNLDRVELFGEIRTYSNDLAHAYKRLVDLIENYSSFNSSKAIDVALIGHCFREIVNGFSEYIDKKGLLASDQGSESRTRKELLSIIDALDDIEANSGLQYAPVPIVILKALKEFAKACQTGSSYAEARISAAAYGNSNRRGIAMEPWERAGEIGAQNAHLKRKEDPVLPDRAEFEEALLELERAIKMRLNPIFAIKEEVLAGLTRANRTDTSGGFEHPAKESVAHIARMINSDNALEALFFARLVNPLWLEVLDEIGYFDTYLLGTEKNVDSTYFTPLLYIQRCAPLQPDSTLCLLQKLGNSESPSVREAMIKIACELPNEQMCTMVRTIALWPMFAPSANTIVRDSHSLGTLLERAINSESKKTQKAAIKIFRNTVEFHPVVHSEFYRDITTHIDRHDYFDFVSLIMSNLDTARRFGISKHNLISYIEAKGGDSAEGEATCIFMPSVALDELHRIEKESCLYSSWAIEMHSAIQEQLHNESTQLVSAISNEPPIVKRIILQALHEWINAADRSHASDEYARNFLNHIFQDQLLYHRCYEVEALPLLRDFARMGTREDIAAFFEQSDNQLKDKLTIEYRKIIDMGVEKRQAYTRALRRMEILQQGILVQFDKEQISVERFRTLCSLNRKLGPFEKPRKLITTVSFTGPNSPIDPSTFIKMGPRNALRFLERWQPTQQDANRLVDKSGVSRTLARTLEEKPFFFDGHIDEITGLESVYLEGILSGWRKALEQGDIIPAGDAVHLCYAFLQQYDNMHNGDTTGDDQSARDSFLSFAWFLETILDKGEPWLNPNDMGLILASLELLLKHTTYGDKENEQERITGGDLLSAAINSLRPITISNIARWLSLDIAQTAEMTTRAFSLLYSALPTETDSPLDVVALSEQLPHLLDRSYNWVQDNYEKIFGNEAPSSLQKLALSSILELYRPSSHLLSFLSPSIKAALDLGAETYPLCAQGLTSHNCLWNIGSWLYECYVIGEIELQDPLLIIWESKADEIQTNILNSICAKVDHSENVSEIVIERVKLLWEHCSQQADGGAKEFKGAAHLLNTGYYEDEWIKGALLTEAKSHDSLDALFFARMQLISLANNDPTWGLTLLRTLLEHDQDSRYYHYEEIALPLLKLFLSSGGSKDNPDFTFCQNRLGKIGMLDLDEKLNIS